MAMLTVLYGRPSDPDAFRDHYVNQHLPLAKALPGATDLRYTLTVDTLSGENVFAAFHATFGTVDEIHAALASVEGKAAQEDVARFADGGVTILVEHG